MCFMPNTIAITMPARTASLWGMSSSCENLGSSTPPRNEKKRQNKMSSLMLLRGETTLETACISSVLNLLKCEPPVCACVCVCMVGYTQARRDPKAVIQNIKRMIQTRPAAFRSGSTIFHLTTHSHTIALYPPERYFHTLQRTANAARSWGCVWLQARCFRQGTVELLQPAHAAYFDGTRD